MSRRDRNKPLSTAQIAKVAEKFGDLTDSDNEIDYEDENASDDDFVLQENVSESEDDIDVESEEGTDVEPDSDDQGHIECEEYIARSGMKWSSTPKRSSRRLARNILDIHPGITPYSRPADTFVEIFNLFISTEIKNIICLYTNQEAERYFTSWNDKHPHSQRKWKSLDHAELVAFLDILIKAGALRCRKESVRELWTIDPTIRRAARFSMLQCRETGLQQYQFICGLTIN